MNQLTVRRMLVVLAFIAAGAAPIPAAGDDLTPDQQAKFLLTAKIVAHKNIPRGITHPVQVTLSDGTVTHAAAFSNVDEHVSIMHFQSGKTELNFVDSYKYNVAAYRVAQLLGLDDMMPVTVEREVDHTKGSLAWWVDDVAMDEGDRLKKHAEPPDPAAWNNQMYRMRVFSQLVADTDRNVGNVLITKDWKLWMIDFTRGFRRNKNLLEPKDVTHCDRQLFERLKALNKDDLAKNTKGFLGGSEIDALMARRDELVKLINQLVAEKGEDQVLY